MNVCIKAVLGAQIKDGVLPGGRIISKGMVYDDTGTLQLVFFNNRYISAMIHAGEEYYFYGRVTGGIGGWQMISPTFHLSARAQKFTRYISRQQVLIQR